ncbi:MAG: hypothetical protein DRG24_04135 [Epsilonproteobacteria bacterium]|nr:MAG: hypothetical protein DRG24_04135 [Campylobacterota bacterium]
MLKVVIALAVMFSISFADGPILKTGQIASYFEGDDGSYKAGVVRSYTRDDIKGIVTDNTTGLQWQDNITSIRKQWVTDTNFNAETYDNTSGDTATTYCFDLNISGLKGWRLPTIEELATLKDRGRSNLAIDAIFQNSKGDTYWSSTTTISTAYNAFSVRFNNGSDGYSSKDNNNYVRCVKGEALVRPNYIRNQAKDTVLGSGDLVWQDNSIVASQKLTWDAAINYCESLEFANEGDWRLPNIYELYMIIDKSRYDPAMMINNGFQHVVSLNYWSSTTFVDNTNYAWLMYFNDGRDSTISKASYNKFYVRCVRGGEITPVNTSPIATDNSYITPEDTPKSGNVITDGTPDSDADGDPLQVSIWEIPSNGILSTTNTNGSFIYTPNSNYNGTDNFRYTLSDGNGGEDNATVQVTIGAVNDIPVITEGESISVTMSKNGNPTTFSLTLNATDNDDDIITWNIKANPTHGVATATGTGESKAIDYAPTKNYHGTDSFIVEVTDGNGVDEIIVNIKIEGSNINALPAIIMYLLSSTL